MIENYYENREHIVSEYLEKQVIDKLDREIFIKQNSQVKVPFIYDWIGGQDVYLRFIGSVSMFATLFLCIALAPLFAGEYHQNASSILLCAKYGREKLARAKIRAAIIITSATYILSMAIYLICQLIFVGTRGLSSPIQLIKPIATAPLSIAQAEIFAVIAGLLDCFAVAAFTITLSSKMSSAFPVITISLLVLLLPLIVRDNLPEWLKGCVKLFPFASDYSELFRINIYHVLGIRIWSPYLLLFIPVLIILLSIPIIRYCYENKQA